MPGPSPALTSMPALSVPANTTTFRSAPLGPIPTATALPRRLTNLTTVPTDMGTAIPAQTPLHPRRRMGTGLTAAVRGLCRRSRRLTATVSPA